MTISPTASRLIRRLAIYAGLVVVSVVVLFPLYYALVISLVTDADVSQYPPTLLPIGLHFENFSAALQLAPLPRYLLNSFIQSSIVSIAQLILASMAAYAFAFIPFKGKQVMFFVFLSTMMIPWEATIIPNYLTIRSLGWGNTFQGLTAPFLATAFGTFLLRQFFLSIPKDLHDASIIDGASHLRFLMTILIPLSRPAMGTLAIYSFLNTYNQFLWPLLITNDKNMRTVQIGIALLENEEQFKWNVVMAGVVIILLPTILLFIFGNRQLIRGLTAGAVKG